MEQFDDLKNILEKHPFILGGKKSTDMNVEALGFSQYGLKNYKQQNYVDAIADFTKAVNAQPTNQNFYIWRGTAYEDMGNDSEAAKNFTKALQLSPEDYLAAFRLGMVYFRKQQFENAVNYLKVAFDNYPDLLLSQHIQLGSNNILFVHKKIIAGNLGNFLVQLSRYEEGIKYLSEAIKIDPQYPNPIFAKGFALVQMGKPKEGILYIKKAAELGFPQAGMMLNQMRT